MCVYVKLRSVGSKRLHLLSHLTSPHLPYFQSSLGLDTTAGAVFRLLTRAWLTCQLFLTVNGSPWHPRRLCGHSSLGSLCLPACCFRQPLLAGKTSPFILQHSLSFPLELQTFPSSGPRCPCSWPALPHPRAEPGLGVMALSFAFTLLMNALRSDTLGTKIAPTYKGHLTTILHLSPVSLVLT